MIELAWFVAGVAATIATLALLRARAAARVRPAPPEPLVETVAPDPIPPEMRRVALSFAEELANLVSGVEGQAHHLIETAPNRRDLPAAAESLLAAVHRLRTLHTKALAFGRGRTSTTGTVDVADLIAGLHEELQQLQLGLEVRWSPPSGLPRINCPPDVVRDALLFLCAALVRTERGATHLSIEAEPCFAAEEPRVQIELALEWVADRSVPLTDLVAHSAFTLDLEAANNLIVSHGGEISLWRLPGRSVRAVVWWPALVPEEREAHGPPAAAESAPHLYGGVLLLEADPAIRAMLAAELKATGRAVFACADIASARSFLEATPDRFELLILDHHDRLEADETLLQTIKDLVPGLKICVLGQGEQDLGRSWPRLHRIQKPFGVHELRAALASVLTG